MTRTLRSLGFGFALLLSTSSALLAQTTHYRSIGTAGPYGSLEALPADGAGTQVSVTNLSNVVDGVGGTAWRDPTLPTRPRGRGDRINIAGVDYTVLRVETDTRLYLTEVYAGATATVNYTISRKFTTVEAWVACIEFDVACEGVSSSSLVADDRAEVGIAFKDSVFVPTIDLQIPNNALAVATDATHDITLTADPGNRHHGVPGGGVVLDNPTCATPRNSIRVYIDYFTLEWIEIRNASGDAVKLYPQSSSNHFVVRNNLIRYPDCAFADASVGADALDLDSQDSSVISAEIYNNVISRGRYNIIIDAFDEGSSDIRLFNNTVYDCGLGAPCGARSLAASNTHIRATNNIFHTGVGQQFSIPTPHSSTGYNITSDTTATANCPGATCQCPAGSCQVSVALGSLSFVDSANDDFHIQPGSTAEDAGLDLSGTFSTDIDNQTRSGSWDIGADEIAATALFRSVGNTATALASGAGNALTISGSTATFGSGLPAIIGVGDAIQYDSDGNGSIDAIAFIHGRTDSQTYVVKDKNGAAPAAVIGDNDWTTYRAYTSLSNWQAQDENDTIDDSVENFDTSRDLVAGGAVMEAACYNDGPMNDMVNVTGWTTGPRNYVRIFSPAASYLVGASQRHTGRAGTGFRLTPTASGSAYQIVNLDTGYIRVEGLEIDGSGVTNARYVRGIRVRDGLPNVGDIRIDSCLIHGLHTTQSGFSSEGSMGIIDVQSSAGSGPPLLITNNVIYNITNTVLHGHIAGIHVGSRGTSYAYNNTVYYINNIGSGGISGPAWGIYTKAWPAASGTATLIATNNYVGDVRAPLDPGGNHWCFDAEAPGGVTTQSNNVSSDGTAVGQTLKTDYVNYFQNINPGLEDLHLQGPSSLPTIWNAAGTDLSATFSNDLDGELRSAPWDIGADEFDGTTVVELMSFEAWPMDAAVGLQWRTGSELHNLGFHVRRSLSEAGPWERVTSSLIPGLGSSPEGASYSWTDPGLVNGTRYFYRLEDIDTASVSTFHGPVSAVPQPPVGGGEGEPGTPAPGPGPEPGPPGATEPPPPGKTPPVSETSCPEDGPCLYGDPGEPSFRVLSHSAREMTVELVTPGFAATPDPDGLSVDVAGFASPTHTHAVDLPFKRALLDAVVGRRARLVSIEAEAELSFPDLRPATLGIPEVDEREDGTVRPIRRRLPVGPSALAVPRARIAGDAFMGQAKKLALEMHPLRWDPAQNRLVLSQTLRVRIAFAGDVPGESGTGSFGRRNPRPRRTTAPVLAHFHTTQKGLHAVAYEDVFSRPGRGIPVSALRLSQGGRVVPLHVEPPSSVFGPGSRLFFHADRTASSTDYTAEVSWALERASGAQMATGSAAPTGAPLGSASYAEARFETQKIYQSGLLDAPDIWLWDFAFRGLTKDLTLSLEGVDTTSPLQARVRLYLQGGSDSARVGEHHFTASWNGVPLDDISFEGKKPYLLEGLVPAANLNEGANTLTLSNVGDTGVYSLVFLDKVEVSYPQAPALRAGRFDGAWTEDGVASIVIPSPLVGATGEESAGRGDGGSLVARPGRAPLDDWGGRASSRPLRALAATFSSVAAVDVTDPAAPVWLSGLEAGAASVRMQVEGERRYAIVSPEGLLAPRVSRPLETALRDTRLQADYILVAPEAFMDAAQPLLLRRESQGLTTFAASLEQIASEFGGGSPSGEAIRDFLAFAFHSWKAPAPRYVLLLGDASYDPRNFTGSDPGAPLPALWTKTSYLWTASDPALAAVNGEDLLPDLALGRLPATNLAQAQALVQKVLDWEDAGYDLSGPATLVADDPDRAGNFEADIADISNSFLAPRNPQSLLVRVLGASTKPAILGSMNSGLSLLSYVGHGAPASWASENVLNSLDPPALQAQSRQPLMLTLNCLNGYFVSPVIDSLAEAFLKVEGRGTIAAFSPSGLSLDGPAHVFHRALVNEVVNGNHHRLGDVVLAAQNAYALSGQMPELLAVYNLLGDPAMRIR